MKRQAGLFALVTRQGDFEVLRPLVRAHLIHQGDDLVRRLDQVFTLSLDDVQRDHVLVVQACVALLLLVAVHYMGDVLEVNGLSLNGIDDQIVELIDILEFT